MMLLLQEIETIDRREEDEALSTEDLAGGVSLKFELITRLQMEETSWR